MSKVPMGPKSRLTAKTKRRILDAVRAGNYLETAAAYAGIHRVTLFNWLAHGRKLREQLEARAEAEVDPTINVDPQEGEETDGSEEDTLSHIRELGKEHPHFRHIPTAQQYKFFWIMYCSSVDIEKHCQNCLIGTVSRKLGSRHIGGAKTVVYRSGVILNEDSARLIYICGVAEPYQWERNFHLALKVAFRSIAAWFLSKRSSDKCLDKFICH